MDIYNSNKLLLDLKTTLFLPPFYEELYQTYTTDHQKSIKEFYKLLTFIKNLDFVMIQNQQIQYNLQSNQKQMMLKERIGFQLAQLIHRTIMIFKIIRQITDSSQLSIDHLDYLSKNKIDYYTFFDLLIKKYENDVVKIQYNHHKFLLK